MARTGRPNECHRTGAIVKYVKMGLAPQRAALAAGLGEQTWYDWKERARLGREPYASSVAKVLHERARFEAKLLSKAVQHGMKSSKAWAALITVLERTGPEDYSSRARLEIEVESRLAKVVPKLIEAVSRHVSRESYLAIIDDWARELGLPDLQAVGVDGAREAPPTQH